MPRIFEPAVVRTPRVTMHVLYSDGNPGQRRQCFAFRRQRVNLLGLAPVRAPWRASGKADLRIVALDPGVVRLGHGERGSLTFLHRRTSCIDGERS